MKKILKEVVTDNGGTSSGRVINVLGAIVGTILVLYHGLWLDTLNYDVFGVYLAYCAGVYGTSKYLDRKYGGRDDRDYNEDRDRFETSGDSHDEYNVSGTRGR